MVDLYDSRTKTILLACTDFDFLDVSCRYYEMEFRIVRFLVDGGKYICVSTNLSEEEFPLEEIRKLYQRR